MALYNVFLSNLRNLAASSTVMISVGYAGGVGSGVVPAIGMSSCSDKATFGAVLKHPSVRRWFSRMP
jgi:hypothetical protein